MFGYDNIQSLSVCIGDPGADKNPVLFRAPGPCEITKIEAVDGVGLAAGTANYFSVTVYNGGTSGTAQTTVGSAVGGTAASGTAPAWTAQLPKAMSLGDGTMSEGQYLWAAYDETGTCAQFITFLIEYRLGVAA
jgi:hypothetical protein